MLNEHASSSVGWSEVETSRTKSFTASLQDKIGSVQNEDSIFSNQNRQIFLNIFHVLKGAQVKNIN
jgi:hypothetical protein